MPQPETNRPLIDLVERSRGRKDSCFLRKPTMAMTMKIALTINAKAESGRSTWNIAFDVTSTSWLILAICCWSLRDKLAVNEQFIVMPVDEEENCGAWRPLYKQCKSNYNVKRYQCSAWSLRFVLYSDVHKRWIKQCSNTLSLLDLLTVFIDQWNIL